MSRIEALFRKELRTKLPPDGPLRLKPTGTREERVAERLFQSIFKERRAIVKAADGFEATTLERELTRQLAMLLEHESFSWPPVLMERIPEALIERYAQEEGISAPPAPEAYPALRTLIEELHAAQAQTKPSLRKSFAFLKARLKSHDIDEKPGGNANEKE